MIVFDLLCSEGHAFEGWFRSSDDFEAQQARDLVACPVCDSPDITKAPMAPAVAAKGNRQSVAMRAPLPKDIPDAPAPAPMSNQVMPPEVARAIRTIAKAQAKALANSRWVGDSFAETSRAMHYGEREHATVHGRATQDEARELAEEGIAVAPLLIPVAAPDEVN